MHTVDVIHAAATVTVALFVIKALQSILEYYAGDSAAAAAARFIYGAP